jgi:hypothetical protein
MSILNKLFTGTLTMLLSQTSVAQFFTNPKHPANPGQRQAQIFIDLVGAPVSAFKSSIVYGTDSLAVVNAFYQERREPSKYHETPATLSAINDGKAKAVANFPHRDNPVAGTGRVFSWGTKIFYAWTRSFRPNGASSDLVLNSLVYSFIMPRPLTIAYLGDSYASGEGGKGDGDWMHEPCHRSANSGGERAIRRLINDLKEFEIDYINTTCSGARVLDYFAEAQKVEPGKTAIKQGIQINLVENWLSVKNYDGIDLLLADGGGNDIGFGNVVTGGILSFINDLKDDDDLRNDLQRELNQLPETYELFLTYLESKITVGRIIWFNYPNPMTGNPISGGHDANLCKQNITRLDCWGPLEKNISNEDWQYVHDEVFVKLNQKVAEAAQTHSWDFVDVADNALRKGICNCGGYFNTIGQSILRQGDVYGTMHPNTTGFREIYSDALFNQLKASISKYYTGLFKDKIERAKEAAAVKTRAKIEAAKNKDKILNRVDAHAAFINKLKSKLKPMDLQDIKK